MALSGRQAVGGTWLWPRFLLGNNMAPEDAVGGPTQAPGPGRCLMHVGCSPGRTRPLGEETPRPHNGKHAVNQPTCLPPFFPSWKCIPWIKTAAADTCVWVLVSLAGETWQGFGQGAITARLTHWTVKGQRARPVSL